MLNQLTPPYCRLIKVEFSERGCVQTMRRTSAFVYTDFVEASLDCGSVTGIEPGQQSVREAHTGPAPSG